MENLLQIKDLFQGKNKIDSYNVKEDKWLKSQLSREHKFKNFSQALNKQIEPEDFQQKKNQDSTLAPEEVNKIVNSSVETIKPDVQKQKDDSFEETESLEESSLVIPAQPVVHNDMELNAVELCNEEVACNKENLTIEDDKISLEDAECFTLKDFNERTDNLSEKISQKENEAIIIEARNAPINHEEKKNFNEITHIPFVVETQNNFQAVNGEEILTEEDKLSDVMPKAFESEEKEVIPQEIKHKIGLDKKTAKVPVQKIKELVASNILTQQKPVNVFDKFAQIKNLDFSRNFGTDHALKNDKIKVGIVSTKQISSFNVEGSQKHRMTEQNVQQALEISSQENAENRISSLRQDTLIFKQEENSTAPKIVIQKYDEARQNYTDSVSGVIAAISEQMEELKRVRRNSLNVKIDLANGESLNCQLVLSKENLNVRFPSMAEAFKTQLLEHWHQLKQFAEERNFNLSTPYFANPLS